MKFHTKVSLAKSVLRIVGAAYLLFDASIYGITIFAIAILLAELFGIAEEFKGGK